MQQVRYNCIAKNMVAYIMFKTGKKTTQKQCNSESYNSNNKNSFSMKVLSICTGVVFIIVDLGVVD